MSKLCRPRGLESSFMASCYDGYKSHSRHRLHRMQQDQIHMNAG